MWGVSGESYDITDRKKAEAELKAEGFHNISEVERIRGLIKEVDDQLLHLARGIIPLNLSGSDSLCRSLTGPASDIEERYDIRCTTCIARDLSFGSDEQATHVYRIVQEAVHHAALHGEASEVAVELLPKRDAVDARLIEEVRNGTGTYGNGIISSQSDVGGWPELKHAEAPTDIDHDGMPDDWRSK